MKARLQLVSLLALLPVAGCMKMVPPTAAPERAAVEVDAPFDSTWDAVIDVFASENIPIQTLDRSSGLIVAEPLSILRADADEWASCGGVKHGLDPVRTIHATHVEFNVLVRSRQRRSTVRANARWTSRNPTDPMRPEVGRCETTNVWEGALESLIRTAAEGSIIGDR